MPDTPSTDGSEDSWTFLDDVENNGAADAIQSVIVNVKPTEPIVPSDVESVDDDQQPSGNVHFDLTEEVEAAMDAADVLCAETKR